MIVTAANNKCIERLKHWEYSDIQAVLHFFTLRKFIFAALGCFGITAAVFQFLMNKTTSLFCLNDGAIEKSDEARARLESP